MIKNIIGVAQAMARTGKLPINHFIGDVAKNGTIVKVINKGQGYFEKVVITPKGDIFESVFNNTGFLHMQAKNARGQYKIVKFPPIIEKFRGSAPIYTIDGYITNVKGINPIFSDGLNGSKIASSSLDNQLRFNYLVRGNSNAILDLF